MRFYLLSGLFIAFLCLAPGADADTPVKARVFDKSGQAGEPGWLGLAVFRAATGLETTVAGTEEELEIVATLQPSPAQVGRQADTFLIAEIGGVFYGVDARGDFLAWNGKPSSLPVHHAGLVLASSQELSVFEGKLPPSEKLRLFFGYSMAGESAIYYTPYARKLEVGDPFLTSLDPDADLPGVDYGQLANAALEAAKLPYLNSLLVAKNGRLVSEHYFGPFVANDKQHLRSVSKSITGLLVGQAIGRAIFTGVGQTLGSFAGDFIPRLPANKAAIQIRHLLSMTSGLDWHEGDGNLYDTWSQSRDPVGFVLSRNLVAAPGTTFAYNSAAVNLFSPMLTSVTGDPINVFAQEALFDSLGIEDVTWERLGNGLPNSGGGMQMRPRDLVKIGNLVLNNGLVIDDRGQVERLVAAKWLRELFTPRVVVNQQFGDFSLESYASLWWIAKAGGKTVYLAWGWAGQFLAVIPELDVVVVTTADWENTGSNQASLQEQTIAGLIVNQVLPALL